MRKPNRLAAVMLAAVATSAPARADGPPAHLPPPGPPPFEVAPPVPAGMGVVSLPIYLFPTPAIPAATPCTPPPPIMSLWGGPYATPVYLRTPELPPELAWGVAPYVT